MSNESRALLNTNPVNKSDFPVGQIVELAGSLAVSHRIMATARRLALKKVTDPDGKQLTTLAIAGMITNVICQVIEMAAEGMSENAVLELTFESEESEKEE